MVLSKLFNRHPARDSSTISALSLEDLSETSFSPPFEEKQPRQKSLLAYFLAELKPDAHHSSSSESQKTERIVQFLQVPNELERLMGFGYLICLDSFLYLFTILPIRILLAFVTMVRRTQLSQGQITDLLKGLLLVSCSKALQSVDASRLYHLIRGQAIIKLYVIFNALEICDKLACAFGHDIIDTLFAPIHDTSKINRRFNRLTRFIVTFAYVCAHSIILFYQVMALNVAINSYNNALLTLLISNQFVEIKSSVFKRFERGNLFQLSCADIVERFQLSVFLIIATIRNCLEIFGGGALADISGYTMFRMIEFKDACIQTFLTGNFPETIKNLTFNDIAQSNEIKLLHIIFGPMFMVMGTEIIVDWIKHAFIIKFNGMSPKVYQKYKESLGRDMLGINAKQDSIPNSGADKSPLVGKRIGFVAIPLACLVIRISIQMLEILGIGQEPSMPTSNQSSFQGDYSGEDENVGSWKLPSKLGIWIKSTRAALGQKGFSSLSLGQRYYWVIPLFLCLTLFKLLLGVYLLSSSRAIIMAGSASDSRDKSSRPKSTDDIALDKMFEKHTPSHMLAREFMSSPKQSRASSLDDVGNVSVGLDSIDRFTMVKSRIP
jgi:Eukaryotic membrane protein family